MNGALGVRVLRARTVASLLAGLAAGRRFIALLSILLLYGSIRAQAQAPQPELDELQLRLNRIAETDLPDFAPNALRSVRAQMRELHSTAAEKGSVSPEELRRVQLDLDALQSLATRTRSSIGKAYSLRNAALQSSFVRASNPARLARAEEDYRGAQLLAAERRFDEARQRAARAARQYESLINNARTQARQQLGATLERYQGAIRTDLAVLADGATDPQHVASMESVARRIVRGNHGFDINGNGLFEYEPPLPDPPGPVPASVFIEDRGIDSIRLWWFDISDDETGSRIMRTTDLLNWEAIRDLPAIPKSSESRHTDTNLRSDRQHCYAIESFNALGTRRGPIRCTYTRTADDVGIWRMELRVKVADVSDAGTDGTPRITIGNDGLHVGADTAMDYGRDDFERNSDQTFDLNLGYIRWLSDVTDVALFNSTVDDVVMIEELTLLINQRVAFKQSWGSTAASALRVGSLHISHAELRANPAWRAYVQASLSNPTFNAPPFRSGDTGFMIQIPKEQIVSRIESIVGHTLHTDSQLRGHLRWGFLHGPAVEIERVRSNAVRVDLDTEATVDIIPNPEVDIDFDLVVSRRCESDKLLLDLKTENATTDAGFAWWKDILSLGLLPAGLAIHEACSGSPDVPSIQQTVEMAMKKNECEALTVGFAANADLEICCVSPESLRKQ